MKYLSILGIAALVVASGTIGAFGFTLFHDNTLSASGLAKEGGALINGHVTYTLKDADGNIKEIRQTDNQIVNTGENCIAKYLFHGTTASDSVCTGALNQNFQYIRIGTGGDSTSDTTNPTSQAQNYLIADADTGIAGTGLDTKKGSLTWTNSTGDSTASVAKVSISATFTNDSGAGSQDIDEAALTNGTSTTADPALAIQDFAAISVGASETLDVQWDITIGTND